MPIVYIYNTLSRKIEEFIPFSPGRVQMYVCGPTVYDFSHLGHARTYVAFDIIKRYLVLRGYDVFHVQNITDIDDKIINRAKQEGKDWKEIADFFTKDYLNSLKRLNINVDLHPRVTYHIKEIIEYVSKLIDKGYAYIAPSGSVYFDVDKYDDYGALSNRRDKEQWSQEEFAKEKRNPYDFALWKAAKPGEPYWNSPWGPGRPGWHIECSVMSSKYLGNQIDIHGGGTDLIFPHHENERAQSEALLGVKPWVKYWVHTGLLSIGGEKMSKSLGNIMALKDLFKQYKPEVIRLWLASAHYRKILNFTDQSLEQARQNFERLINATSLLRDLISEEKYDFSLNDKDIKYINIIKDLREKFYQAMDNDFNTSAAFSQIYQVTNLLFKEIQYNSSITVLLKIYAFLGETNRVFGILDKYLIFQSIQREIDVETLINLVVDIRSKLRKRKIFDISDWIRDQLLQLGIKLSDTKEETKWQII